MRLPSQAELRAELQRIDGTIVGYLLSKRSPPRELLSSSDRLHEVLRKIARRKSARTASPPYRRWA